MNVIISRKCIPTNFFVIDAYHSNHDHIILVMPFLKLVDSLCFVETLGDPLQRAMENQVSDQQDEELDEAMKGLEPQKEEKFEDIGEIKPEEPQMPEVELKPLPKGLKYEFLGPDKTYLVIVSDELSPAENEKLLILLENIGR
jgi:hypothetical protein